MINQIKTLSLPTCQMFSWNTATQYNIPFVSCLKRQLEDSVKEGKKYNEKQKKFSFTECIS